MTRQVAAGDPMSRSYTKRSDESPTGSSFNPNGVRENVQVRKPRTGQAANEPRKIRKIRKPLPERAEARTFGLKDSWAERCARIIEVETGYSRDYWCYAVPSSKDPKKVELNNLWYELVKAVVGLGDDRPASMRMNGRAGSTMLYGGAQEAILRARAHDREKRARYRAVRKERDRLEQERRGQESNIEPKVAA